MTLTVCDHVNVGQSGPKVRSIIFVRYQSAGKMCCLASTLGEMQSQVGPFVFQGLFEKRQVEAKSIQQCTEQSR